MKVLQPETVLKMKSTTEVFHGIFQNFNHNSYLNKFAPMLLNIFIHLRLPSYYLLVQIQQLTHLTKVWNMFKVNNKNTRSGVLIVNFEHIVDGFIIITKFTLSIMPARYLKKSHWDIAKFKKFTKFTGKHCEGDISFT